MIYAQTSILYIICLIALPPFVAMHSLMLDISNDDVAEMTIFSIELN